MNSCLLKKKKGNVQKGLGRCSSLGLFLFEREKELLLSGFEAVRTVGSRRSKKQSRSMRRGLRVDTDLVEF